jgi:translation elongation factor EF-G
MNRPELVEILAYMAKEQLAVLSLTPGAPPTFTHIGVAFHAEEWYSVLTKEECQRLIHSVMYEEQRQALSSAGESTVEFTVTGLAKFRMKPRCDDKGNISATVEIIENRRSSATALKEPVMFAGLTTAASTDKDRLTAALSRITKEDGSLQLKTEHETGQFTLFGMSEQHLIRVRDRLRTEFQLAVGMDVPRVAYKETVRESVAEEANFVRSWNLGTQYGHCVLAIEPLAAGRGFVYRNVLAAGRLPAPCVAAIEEGVREAVQTGALAGYPLTDLFVSLIDGPYRQTDFDETAFKIAGAMALRLGCRKASPVILEPAMRCEIAAPEQFLPDIVADLNRRRANITEIGDLGPSKRIRCTILISELFGYDVFLRSVCQNRAAFIMEPSHYEEISFAQWKASNDPHSPDEPPTASAGRPVMPTRPKPGIPGDARKPFPPDANDQG